MFGHEQTKVFYPEYEEFIEVDTGLAPLLIAIWDAGILTCNSCEENEPEIMWIEFYSIKDAEKFLMIIIKSLGNRIHSCPEAGDWFCYRILGQFGERLSQWRYEAHPNLYPARPNQGNLYSKNLANCRVELSISVRFPREDYRMVLDLLSNYLLKFKQNFKEMSDDQWNYIQRYLPPQPIRGRRRLDDRRTLNGILYVLQTGCVWRELPRRYGSYITAQRRLRQWSEEGLLDKILSNTEYKDRLEESSFHYSVEMDGSGLGSKKEKYEQLETTREGRANCSIMQQTNVVDH